MGARFVSWIRSIAARRRFEAAVSDELEFHIETRARHLMTLEGIGKNEALRKARLEFGSREKYREERGSRSAYG